MNLPLIPGIEAAGIVEVIGPDVTEFKVDFTTAAAVLLQGMTAHGLTHGAYPVQPGDIVLVHAAGSGVGLYLVQMAKQRGATVIGTVSTSEKARLAQRCGADHTILYTEDDFEAAIQHLTKNRGSLFLTWATLSDYAASREDLLWRARDVLTWVAEKKLVVHIAHCLPLVQAAETHRLLESRQIAGKIILIPE